MKETLETILHILECTICNSIVNLNQRLHTGGKSNLFIVSLETKIKGCGKVN